MHTAFSWQRRVVPHSGQGRQVSTTWQVVHKVLKMLLKMFLCACSRLLHVSKGEANKSWRQAQFRHTHTQLEPSVTAVLQSKGDEKEQLGKV